MNSYGCNHCLMPTTLVLLRRLRAALDAKSEDGCQLTDDELIARGLSALCEREGVSGHTCAADLSRAAAGAI